MRCSLAVRVVLTLFIFLLTISAVKAQEGGYFLSHHRPTGNFDEVSFDILQDQNGVMYIANRTGVMTFDGKHWNFLKTPAAIFSLTLDESTNTIYTAGRNGFGKLRRDNFFNLDHATLSDSTLQGADIFSTLVANRKLYGINEDQLFQYDLETGHLKGIRPKHGGYLTGLFVVNSEILVLNTTSGVLSLKDDELVSTTTSGLTGLFAGYVASFEGESLQVIEKEDGSLWLLENGKLAAIPLQPEDELLFRENRIQQIEWINKNLIAVSTLTGGVVFLEPRTGKLVQVLDAESGLPDDDIYFISADIEKSLWISHKKGFTRVSPSIPFRTFDGYEGLQGELLTTITHKGKLYVGTTNGLYALETVKEYTDEVYTETREVSDSENKTLATDSRRKKKKKGLFRFLKRKTVVDETLAHESNTSKPNKKTVTERKVRKKLHSIFFQYNKVKEINSSVSELFSDDQTLFVGTLSGFFTVESGLATKILNEPVRSLYYSEHYKTAFVGTNNGEIRVFNLGAGVDELYLFGSSSYHITHIFEDDKHRIWLCGTDRMLWLTLAGSELGETGEVPFDNPFFYDTYGAAKNDTILFVNEAGIYHFQNDEMAKVAGPCKFVKGSGSEIWILAETGWQLLNASSDHENFGLLTVFDHPKYLSLEADYIWLVSDESLLRTPRVSNNVINSTHELLLRGVGMDPSGTSTSGKLVLDQDKSALKFEFVKPDYSGIMDIQYQYKLDGLTTSKWTEWSADYSTINFPYLPEGDYILNVRSKDVFGTISNSEVINFKIVPPYWKRPWFYALEFTALGMLLIISLRIKRLGYRYRLGSRLLALLTLIIIIEFIQTIAENEFQTKSSAIFDFAIQVLMAIIILPLEGVLRKYIFKEKNVHLLDFFRLKEKSNEN
ncbi:MAG: hypothetical protein AAF519_00620 [Bacteroidota bacterium]